MTMDNHVIRYQPADSEHHKPVMSKLRSFNHGQTDRAHLRHVNTDSRPANQPFTPVPAQAVTQAVQQTMQTMQRGSRLDLFHKVLSLREPTFVFIDGANFKYGCDKIGLDFDFAKFWHFLFDSTRLQGSRYYTAMSEKDSTSFVSWLMANGYQTFIKTVREEPASTPMNRRKNIDAELASDMAVLPYTMPDIKHAILLSGDGDYCHTVKLMKDRGVRVSCISPGLNAGITARTLIKEVDFFVPLEDLAAEVDLSKDKVSEPVLRNGTSGL